jgi:hypothetical protein
MVVDKIKPAKAVLGRLTWRRPIIQSGSLAVILNKTDKKTEKVLKQKPLQLTIKKGWCLEIVAANC